MDAGRELDALVAEKVMGLEVVIAPAFTAVGDNGKTIEVPALYGTRGGVLPAYSRKVEAAWLVIEKLQEGRSKEFPRIITVHDFWAGYAECEIASKPDGGSKPHEEWPHVFAHGASPAHAICLAALAVFGVEVPS